MEKELIDLNESEMKDISGGGAYEIGKAFGSYCADCYDFYCGLVEGIFGD